MTADNTIEALARPRGGFQAPVPDDVLADPTETQKAYVRHIERTGLAPSSIRSYTSQSRRFAEWMVEQPHISSVDAFTDPFSRDHAIRDYRSYLANERRLKPASVDAALAALDSFYIWTGLGKANVKRTKSRNSKQFGEGLNDKQVTAVLRQAERRNVDGMVKRDIAIIGVMLLAGARVSEVAALNIGDWWAQERSGAIELRGKGGKIRYVDLSSSIRPILIEWRTERQQLGLAPDFLPCFVSRRGTRIATRSISDIVTAVGAAAGIEGLHPHQLRHTFATKQLESGRTVSEVQQMLGHASMETTQIYTKPTRAAMAERADMWRVER